MDGARKLLLLAVASAFAMIPPIASAIVITSGQITVPSYIGGSYLLEADGLSISGRFSPLGGFWSGGMVGRPGDVIRVSGNQSGNDLAFAEIMLAGTTYNLDVHSLFAEKGSSLNVFGPGLSFPVGAGTIQGAFSFNGAICGTDTFAPGTVHPCIVDLPSLTGSGIVYVDIRDTGSSTDIGAVYQVSELRYVFVPEPGTLALLGLGLACIGLARKRKSR